MSILTTPSKRFSLEKKLEPQKLMKLFDAPTKEIILPEERTGLKITSIFLFLMLLLNFDEFIVLEMENEQSVYFYEQN